MGIRRGDIGSPKWFSLSVSPEDGVKALGDFDVFLGYQLDKKGDEIPNGIWLKWYWNGKELSVSNDIFGMYPAYYYHDSNLFVISNSLEVILRLGVDCTPNDAAIAIFLRLGYYLKDDTPFKLIKSVPPGSRFTIRSGIEVVKERRVLGAARGRPISREKALKEYGEIFETSLSELAPAVGDKIGLPLSGGRDSRHILLGLLATGVTSFECITAKYPPPFSQEDAEIAQVMAREAGLPHTVLPERINNCNTIVKYIVDTNYCSDEHFWTTPLSDYLSGKFNLIYDGIGGDVLSGGLFLSREHLALYESNAIEELAFSLLRNGEQLSRCLLQKIHNKYSIDLALQQLVSELERYASENNPIGQFMFWNRTRREIALCPWSILGKHAHVYAPYLHTEVYQFLRSLPAVYLVDKKFHTEAISLRYPQYTHIPYAPKTSVCQSNSSRYSPVRQVAGVFQYVFDGGNSLIVNKINFLKHMVRLHMKRPRGWQMPTMAFQEIYLKTLEKTALNRPGFSGGSFV